MRSTLIAAFAWGVAFATAQRSELPKRTPFDLIEHEHLGKGIQFKLKIPEAVPKHLRGHDDETTMVDRVVDQVAGLVAHLADGKKPTRLFHHSSMHEERHNEYGLHLWYRMDMTKTEEAETDKFASQKRVVEAVKLIRDHQLLEALEHVEPELRVKLHYTPDDPRYTSQFNDHYDNVRLDEAWDLEMGKPSTVVQVIDSGIDMGHPDLQNNKWANPGEICNNGVDDDNNGYVDDCQGYNHADNSGTNLGGDGSHGTHCAGTVAADTDNGVGVAGVAGGQGGGNPGASLMINTCFGLTSTSGFADALVYGADNGAHISSNSWGYTSANVVDNSVLDAIDYATDLGVIVVFAAGNDNDNGNWYPGYYSKTVAVAATDKFDTAASFTNYGSWIDISAPGVGIISTVIGGYATYSGTSMACPHVAGGLALAKSYYPAATSTTLLNCLFTTAKEIESSNTDKYAGGLGAGLMDIRAMLECMGPSPTPAPTWTPKPSAEPVPAPTKAPIICGSCDRELKLNIQTDNYGSESTWSLDLSDPNACFTGVDGPGSPLASNTGYSITLSNNICNDVEYTFTIRDSYGDGICCSFGSGSYNLALDGDIIFSSNGQFGSSETAKFIAELPDPTPVPIPAPTKAPVVPVPSPTRAPTEAVCESISTWSNDQCLSSCDGNSCHKKCSSKCSSVCGCNGGGPGPGPAPSPVQSPVVSPPTGSCGGNKAACSSGGDCCSGTCSRGKCKGN